MGTLLSIGFRFSADPPSFYCRYPPVPRAQGRGAREGRRLTCSARWERAQMKEIGAIIQINRRSWPFLFSPRCARLVPYKQKQYLYFFGHFCHHADQDHFCVSPISIFSLAAALFSHTNMYHIIFLSESQNCFSNLQLLC